MTTVMEEGGEQGTATVQHNLCRGPGHHFDNELLWLGVLLFHIMAGENISNYRFYYN